MEQLKRWSYYVCMCAFCVPTSHSTTEFQGVASKSQGFHNHVHDPIAR